MELNSDDMKFAEELLAGMELAGSKARRRLLFGLAAAGVFLIFALWTGWTALGVVDVIDSKGAADTSRMATIADVKAHSQLCMLFVGMFALTMVTGLGFAIILTTSLSNLTGLKKNARRDILLAKVFRMWLEDRKRSTDMSANQSDGSA